MSDTLSDPKLSDPKIFGPGLWYSIHITALKLGEESFVNWLRVMISEIPCEKCKNHATEYLTLNPPENYKGIQDESTSELIGMFKWTWKFHNDVNARLSKPILDYNYCYTLYTSSEKCSKECGN